MKTSAKRASTSKAKSKLVVKKTHHKMVVKFPDGRTADPGTVIAYPPPMPPTSVARVKKMTAGMKMKTGELTIPCGDTFTDPVSKVEWVHRDILQPNNYNPNAVAPPELDLLEISILEDGFTQPIVRNPDNTIVDGYHRYMVSDRKALKERYKGFVPVVTLSPKDQNHQMMSTIRHNRARGTHAVLKMADIVRKMIDDQLPMQEIMSRMKMEEEEVLRLANRMGIPASKINMEFGKAWKPKA